MRVTVRLAKNEDGPRISELLAMVGLKTEGWDIDWNDIEPWWIVAELDGVVKGAVQICPSKPIARVEFLAVDPEMNEMDRGRVISNLERQWKATVKISGAGGFAGMIPYEYDSYLNVARRRGYVSIGEGHHMVKRV